MGPLEVTSCSSHSPVDTCHSELLLISTPTKHDNELMQPPDGHDDHFMKRNHAYLGQ